MTTDGVRVSRKGAARWRAGHPWIYASDVERVPASLLGGEVVHVVDGRGVFLGQATYSSKSKISLRAISPTDAPFGKEAIAARIAFARALREQLRSVAHRLVHGEADGLPGLVVDRYADCLVVQFVTQWAQANREAILDALEELERPRAIVNRSESTVRALEGLAVERGLVRGACDAPVRIREGDIDFEIDLLHGQKTGAFLDQRDNRLWVRRFAGTRVLDCFSYQGGFALQLARGSQQVTAVEISESACGEIRGNATRNQIGNIEVVCANAFDFLRDAVDAAQRFDTVVLDPPSFAKTKAALGAALRGYKEVNLRAMLLLRRGGVLVTCSCSHHVDESQFETMLDSAAADARRRFQIIERRGAGIDHPVLVGLRETRYLKCYALRALD